MSPPPCRFRHGGEPPTPPGMTNATAPGVTAPGHAMLLPVVTSTQCRSLARSPLGGAAGAGSALGRPAASGMPSPSGGDGAPLGQPAGYVLLLMVTLAPPPAEKLVTYARPEHDPFCAR